MIHTSTLLKNTVSYSSLFFQYDETIILDKGFFFTLISNPYIIATQCWRSYIFQSINYVNSINLSLKYQRFTPLGCEDIGIGKF